MNSVITNGKQWFESTALSAIIKEKEKDLKKTLRKQIAEECREAIEHEMQMLSCLLDGGDSEGNLQKAFSKIMEIIRGKETENEP